MKVLAFLIIFVSFGVLVPGLTQPVMAIKMKTKVDAKIKRIEMDAYDKERSILGTVQDLYEDDRVLVAFLILLFSVLVPFIKGILLLVALSFGKGNLKHQIFKFVDIIGKWSMADVFVVAVFLVFLATSDRAIGKSFDVSMLGMSLPVRVDTLMRTELRAGFYFFLSYCLLSLVGLHVVKAALDKEDGLSG